MPPRAEAPDGVARALMVGLLLANTVLQKIALPGSGGGLPLSLPVTFGLLGAGIALGRLVPLASVALALVATAGALVLTTGLSPMPGFSANAAALVLTLLIPYAFSFRPGLLPRDFAYGLFVSAALVFAVIGIVQFFAQFVIGADRAFLLDTALPETLILSGFNNLNELTYESSIYKTNGFFLLEASFLNQMLCVAVLIELITRRRLPCLALLVAGILVTYSGTGLMMLAAIAPAYLIEKRQLGLLIFGAVAAVAFVLVADTIGLGLFIDRAAEFNSRDSSAFARFLSIFYLMADYVWTSPAGILFGNGPGSVREHFLSVNFAPFDPSWGKIMYEYGVIGFAAYFSFIFFCVFRSEGSLYLKFALILQFMFLGGYVAIMPVHIEIWMLLIWPVPAASAAAVIRRPALLARLA